MSFFDEVERPPPPPEPQEHEPPPWFQPPSRHVAGLVADRRVVARAADIAVLLSHLDVFPTGCSIRVRVSVVRPHDESERDWQDRLRRDVHSRHFGMHGGGEGPLRFGVDLGAAGRATTDNRHRPHREQPEGPVLHQHGVGGSGSPGEYVQTHHLWLWPLPPARPFDLVFQWHDQGIGETRVELDGAAIVEAAGRSHPLFD